MLLYEKYAPSNIDELLVSNDAKSKLKAYAGAAAEGKKGAPLMVYGGAGTGKTAAVHAMAVSYGFKLIEFNASDYRNSDTLKKRLLPATTTRNLFNEKILILFDEVDELSSEYDYGAEGVILSIIKKSRQPVMLIANDYWNKNIAFLRNQTDRQEFKRAGANDLYKYLSFIAQKEGGKIEPGIVKEISMRANGDIRGALNDLEALLDTGPELMEYLAIRNRKAEVFRVLDKIFTTGSFDVARAAMINSDISLDMLINWIDQNIPAKYLSKKGVREAYEQLSRASMFLEHASRDNYYEYLRYASVIMSAGVSIANDGALSMLTPYSFPAKITHMSRTKRDRNQMNGIALRLSPIVHTSRKQVLNSYLPLMKKILASYVSAGNEDAMGIVERGSGLDKDEIELVLSHFSIG